MHFPEQQLTTYLRVFLPDTRIDAVLDEIAEAALESDVADTVTFFSLAHWLMDADERRTAAMEAVVLVEEVGLSDADVAVILDQDVVEVERAVAQAWDATGLTGSAEAAEPDPAPVAVAIDGSQIEVDDAEIEEEEVVPSSPPTSVLEPTDAETVGSGVENDLAASTVLDSDAPPRTGEPVAEAEDAEAKDASDVESDVASTPVPVARQQSRWGAFEAPESEIRPEDAQADAAAVLAAIESATGQRQRQAASAALSGATASQPETQGRFDPSLILAPLVAKVTPAPPDEEVKPDDWAAAYQEAKAEGGADDKTDDAAGPAEAEDALAEDALAEDNAEDAAEADETAEAEDDSEVEETVQAAGASEAEDIAEAEVAHQADDAEGAADLDGASSAADTVPDTGVTQAPPGAATVDHAELLANLPDGQIKTGSDGPDRAAANLDGDAQESTPPPSETIAAATAQGDGPSKAMSVFRTTLGMVALIGVAVLGFAVFSQAGRDRLSAQGFDPLTAFMVVVGFLGLGMLLLILGGRRRTVRGLEEAGRSWSRATPSAEVARAAKVVKPAEADETTERGDQPHSSTR